MGVTSAKGYFDVNHLQYLFSNRLRTVSTIKGVHGKLPVF